MARHTLRWVSVAAIMASALLGADWWFQPSPAPGVKIRPQEPDRTQARMPELCARAPAASSATSLTAPLLADDVRYTLEALFAQAWQETQERQAVATSDPSVLKRRLAGLIGSHFPADVTTRALALAERYADYRVALGALPAPPSAADLQALRNALTAREHMRRQFFDDAEYAALFEREAALDRYTLARLAIAHNPQLTSAQRAQAWQAANDLLPPERLAQRKASTAHLAVATQTQAFEAQKIDSTQRHAVRSAQYGEAAAQALARLDQEEALWQQRLTLYQRTRAGPDHDSSATQQLREQLFSPAELPRIDAALAWRERPADVGPSQESRSQARCVHGVPFATVMQFPFGNCQHGQADSFR